LLNVLARPGGLDLGLVELRVQALGLGLPDIQNRAGKGRITFDAVTPIAPRFALGLAGFSPSDPTRRQMLPYSFVDRDGDGATIARIGTVSSGATLRPSGLSPYPAVTPLADNAELSPAKRQRLARDHVPVDRGAPRGAAPGEHDGEARHARGREEKLPRVFRGAQPSHFLEHRRHPRFRPRRSSHPRQRDSDRS
jgi:hypothetical protein